MALSGEVVVQVAQLLGREPRGLEAVAVWADDGSPAVIQVCSLVDDTPFPTLYWLVDKTLSYRIDRLEAAGVIAQFQAQVDGSKTLQGSLEKDHKAHIALRERLMRHDIRSRLQALGYEQVLGRRGIGGIADFSRIRCLHTWYAAHLVVPNTIGRLVDEYWLQHS